MWDLNDHYYLVQAVEHGGFSAASRVLDVPKSTLSRRIIALESRLGVRLIQRTSGVGYKTPAASGEARVLEQGVDAEIHRILGVGAS